uniref:A2549-2 n=1 Tax=Anopheles anthropophagus TaxID=74872 RepID=K7N7L3_ANOAT|nr:a2549-2 [Anopheles anthropophagus]
MVCLMAASAFAGSVGTAVKDATGLTV